MKALKSSVYAWIKNQKESVSFSEICNHFRAISPTLIHDFLVEMIEKDDIETIPARYRAK